MTRVEILPKPGARKVVSVTMQTPYEDLATPTNLPTTEPASPQVSWTLVSGDLPTFSTEPTSKVWVGLLYAAGQNTDTAARTLYWRMYKNSGLVAEGSSSVSAGRYWTISAGFYDVALADVLELALWADLADVVNWDYEAHQVHPTRLKFVEYEEIKKTLEFPSPIQCPTLTSGHNPYRSSGSQGYFYCRATSPGGEDVYGLVGSGDASMPIYTHHQDYGAFAVGCGDRIYIVDDAALRSSDTYHPYYFWNWVPTEIIFRNLRELE